MSTLLEDARTGLLSERKWLPPVWFYDDRGSALFEDITETEEYYPTETERGILRDHAEDILDVVGTPMQVAELGAGSASKTITLLEALAKRQEDVCFCPIDVSEEALRLAREGVAKALPDIHVEGILARNRSGIRQLDWDAPNPWLVLFLGSSIGNQEPEAAIAWLREVTEPLRRGDIFLLGVDREKDARVLTAAYNDSRGVTAAFNLNLLERMNRELGADFPLADFEHTAFFHADLHRVEMHLRAKRALTVRIPGIGDVAFSAGETIHTENSYKYTDAMLARLLAGAGLRERARYQDDRGWFNVLLLERAA